MSERSFHFIVNPQSNAGNTGKTWEQTYKQIEKLIEPNHSSYTIADGIGRGFDAATEVLDEEDITHLVSVGGEGGNNEVVNALYKSGKDVTLGFIKSGTANDYQTLINWPRELSDQVEVLKKGSPRQTPLTMVHGDTQRVSLNIADIGVAATAAYLGSVQKRFLRFNGPIRFNLLTFMAIKQWKNIPLRMNADGRELEGDISVFMGGFSKEIAFFKMLPHAEPFADKMAYVAGFDFSKWKMIRTVNTLKAGRHDESIEGIYMGHASKITLDAEKPLLFSVDGEPFSYNTEKLLIESKPDAIKVLNPDSI
ncbi:MAG: hypothetical protein INQ03_26040 [Candidatus Heimdallarchaeota archaeon]|nr:hypothetical protein [Candidatus Heimdallarchaeota archaeon]